jgi:hypothetical protein
MPHGPHIQRTGFDVPENGNPNDIQIPVSAKSPLPVTEGESSEAMIACLVAVTDKMDLILEQLSLITGLENN